MSRLFLISSALMLLSFLASLFAYPFARKTAFKHKLLDNPNSRKLQREAVPCAGGIAIAIGIFSGIILEYPLLYIPRVTVILSSLSIMLALGCMDDRYGLNPAFRFLVEILVVYCFIMGTNLMLYDFGGLWGIEELPSLVNAALSIFVGVGIINAINLIDGVDGLSSGIGMFCSFLFAFFFYKAGSPKLCGLAAVTFGSLIPFFFHNVFGKKSKMFMGDGGTLTLGMMMSILVFSIFSKGSPFVCSYQQAGLSAAAMALSVLSIPVFDVLRVMTVRILKGRSPFLPDKNHLHHDFLLAGFSHFGITVIEVLLDFLVVLSFVISYKLGASIDTQLYVVVIMSIICTEGVHLLIYHYVKKGRFPEYVISLAKFSHQEDRKWWQAIRNYVDKNY